VASLVGQEVQVVQEVHPYQVALVANLVVQGVHPYQEEQVEDPEGQEVHLIRVVQEEPEELPYLAALVAFPLALVALGALVVVLVA